MDRDQSHQLIAFHWMPVRTSASHPSIFQTSGMAPIAIVSRWLIKVAMTISIEQIFDDVVFGEHLGPHHGLVDALGIIRLFLHRPPTAVDLLQLKISAWRDGIRL